MLEAQDLECVKGNDQLFSGFNLSASAGQIIQITGENGSGKTSLLRILTGLSEPESGEVLWQGNSIFDNSAHYQAELAYLGHLNGLKPSLSAIENLIAGRALLSKPSNVSPNQALIKVGLDGYQHIYAYQLSAGQQRRVALARLLLSGAKLWILDEPITAIDPKGVAVFEQMIAEHANTDGLVLLTSHQELLLPDSDFSQVHIGATS